MSSKKSLSIELDSELFRELEKRAKKEFLSPRELAIDIIRRSMRSYKKGFKESIKPDDALVSIFSRQRRKKRI